MLLFDPTLYLDLPVIDSPISEQSDRGDDPSTSCIFSVCPHLSQYPCGQKSHPYMDSIVNCHTTCYTLDVNNHTTCYTLDVNNHTTCYTLDVNNHTTCYTLDVNNHTTCYTLDVNTTPPATHLMLTPPATLKCVANAHPATHFDVAITDGMSCCLYAKL
jgi:hypothetical protein